VNIVEKIKQVNNKAFSQWTVLGNTVDTFMIQDDIILYNFYVGAIVTTANATAHPATVMKTSGNIFHLTNPHPLT
jgi:S-adenosylhomocysteine hydrolase